MRKALHIGQNYTGSPYELPDCHLDALRMLDISEASGYDSVAYAKEGFIPILSAEDFIAELIALREHSTPKSFTLISYSGHGTQYYSSSEADRQEEALVFWSGGEISLFPDDDFRKLLFEIKGTVFVTLDCCYSRGMERNVAKPGRTRRFIECPPNARVVRYEGKLSKAAAAQNRVYFLNASSESEVSWSTGQGGLFTRAFVEAYEKSTIKMRSIVNLIKQAKISCAGEQTPNYVIYGGNATKRVF